MERLYRGHKLSLPEGDVAMETLVKNAFKYTVFTEGSGTNKTAISSQRLSGITPDREKQGDATFSKDTVDGILREKEYTIMSRGRFVVNEECERFIRGEGTTIYAPIVLEVRSSVNIPFENTLGNSLSGSNLVTADTPAYFLLDDIAIISPYFETIKSEMAIIIKRTADSMYGVSQSTRRAIYNDVADMMSKTTYDPGEKSNEVDGLALALAAKVGDIVRINQDTGKVWRSRTIVDDLRRGARDVAALYIGARYINSKK